MGQRKFHVYQFSSYPFQLRLCGYLVPFLGHEHDCTPAKLPVLPA